VWPLSFRIGSPPRAVSKIRISVWPTAEMISSRGGEKPAIGTVGHAVELIRPMRIDRTPVRPNLAVSLSILKSIPPANANQRRPSVLQPALGRRP
jgi:hypothetical protein